MKEMRTYRQWMREGRTVRRGEKARAYLMDDERVIGAPLFGEDQTEPNGGVDQHDTWTQVATVQEYQQIREEARKLRKRPLVKIAEAKDGGVAVWVGPNKEAIEWLQDTGYRYDPKSHRWVHADKDPEYVAQGFATKPDYRVVREWDGAPAPVSDRPAI